MIEIYLRKSGRAFYPADPFSEEEFRSIKHNEEIKAVITRPRSIRFHRFFFALITIVYDAQDVYATTTGLLDALKIAVGHFDEFRDLDGNIHFKPRSMAFANMSPDSFYEFYLKILHVIMTRILPGIKREDIEQQICDILKIPGPEQLKGYL